MTDTFEDRAIDRAIELGKLDWDPAVTEPMVTILSAHCEECGATIGASDETPGRSAQYGRALVSRNFTVCLVQPGPLGWPVEAPVSYVRQPWRCLCGGRIVFALAGVGESDE